jgi:ribosomal protein S18 acetylase RimI-like enzyme
MTAMLRPATPADSPDLIALALAEDAAWSGGPAVSAEEAGEFIGSYGRGVIFERDGRVAGYAATGEGGETIVIVDPGDDPGPALEALAAWLGERGHHQIDTYARDARRIAWLEAHGFTYRRSSFDLQRGIDPPLAPAVWPSAVAVARYRPGEDDDAIHALIFVDAAWGEVPGHTLHSFEAWRSMLTPEYRGWVARRQGRPIGWIVGRVFSEGRGWIQQLAVARSARGRGLGRALLLHSLAELRARGATSLALGVQAENESAIGLYRDIGFKVTREWRVYARPTANAGVRTTHEAQRSTARARRAKEQSARGL